MPDRVLEAPQFIQNLGLHPNWTLNMTIENVITIDVGSFKSFSILDKVLYLKIISQ